MTISQVIINGYLSSEICARYNERQKLFSPALAANQSPVTIKMVSDALFWGYNGGSQTAANLITVANYLIWLCGSFGLQAQQITGTGGAIVPITPVPISPLRQDFYVSATSLLPTGTTTATLTQFLGYNLDFVRNGIPQSQLNTEPSYFSYNRITGAWNNYPALVAGELISIIPSS